MQTYFNRLDQCTICKHEYTTIHCEVVPGVIIFVCQDCLDAAKDNFVWICMGCGQVYLRPKAYVLDRINNDELREAYEACDDVQIIQGLDACVQCDPETIFTSVSASRSRMAC